jgi:hypothetical protein
MMSTFLMQRRLGYFVLCHKLVYEPVIIRAFGYSYGWVYIAYMHGSNPFL